MGSQGVVGRAILMSSAEGASASTFGYLFDGIVIVKSLAVALPCGNSISGRLLHRPMCPARTLDAAASRMTGGGTNAGGTPTAPAEVLGWRLIRMGSGASAGTRSCRT